MSTWLKEYLVILTTSFYGMNEKIQTKKLIFKISVDSNFTFQVIHDYHDYVYFIAPNRLLC